MLEDYIYNKPVIKTERLIMRELVENDVKDLLEWTPNKTIYKYYGKNPGAADLNPSLLFSKKKKPNKSIHLGIQNKENNKIIGDIYIYLIEKNKKAKLAIRINPTYQNRGIATEAIMGMIDFCFANTELKTIWTDVDINNIASIKMLEKSGFEKIKEISEGKMVSVITDFYIFEINKS